MGYAVAHTGKVVWVVVLPCKMAALLIPFPVVPWRDMVFLQQATLMWARGTAIPQPWTWSSGKPGRWNPTCPAP